MATIALSATATVISCGSETRIPQSRYDWKTFTRYSRSPLPAANNIDPLRMNASPIDVMNRLIIFAPRLRIGRQSTNSSTSASAAVAASANSVENTMSAPQPRLARTAAKAPKVR